MNALISASELKSGLHESRLRIVDASWHMPAEKRNAHEEYKATHIPGAVFFDIDAISDTLSPYPHMLPSAEAFAQAVSALSIGNEDEVVVYDAVGLFSAARVWWMFRVFGHDKVRVLNGGLPHWKAEGGLLESGTPQIKPASFKAHLHPELLRTKTQVQANISKKRELLLDARSPERFLGKQPEPRPGLRSGHIEGSKNVFFKECLTPGGKLKSPEELRAVFQAKDIDPNQSLSVTCGSGVTACILALALFNLGNEIVPVYDGAWVEWGLEAA